MSHSQSPPALSRSTSLNSETFRAEQKRTRKRFAKWQTAALEKMYATSTHPSREEREKLAEHLESDLRAITVWFQNKRQTHRKSALGNARNQSLLQTNSLSDFAFSRSFMPFPTYPAISHPFSSASMKAARSLTRTASGFSLDHIASRSELMPRTPRKLSRHKSLVTPATQTSISSDTFWDAMPSSPFGEDSPVKAGAVGSPSTRDLLDFASNRGKKGSFRGRRTLEWACAAARMAPSNDDADSDDDIPASAASLSFARLPSLTKLIEDECTEIGNSENEDEYDVKTEIAEIEEDARTEIVETEAESVPESHEAITPQPSLTSISRGSSPLAKSAYDSPSAKITTQSSQESVVEIKLKKPASKDHETMNAAWVLCGLKSVRN